MNSLAHPLPWLTLSVRWVWQCSIVAQVFVLFLLLFRKSFHKLTLFTVYVALNIGQAGFLLILYSLHGVHPATVRALAWETEAITLVAQALATAEVLGITLRPYPGIWGLGWRALTLISTLVVILVVAATKQAEPEARLFEINRGYHLVFACAVIACLLLVRYYSIPVARAYQLILGGFCFFSCMQVLINTVIEVLFQKRFLDLGPVWEFTTVSSFFIVQVVWAVGLWHPLPGENRQSPSPDSSTYQRMLPAIDEQLRRINEKLARLWKLEARPH
jgi:hypothetical protein